MRLMGAFYGLLVPIAVGAALLTGAAGTAQASPAATAARHAQPASRMPDFGNPKGHAYVPLAGRAVSTSEPNHVIGNGTPASCTSAAVVRNVARGGIITFNCGAAPVTITMTATAKVINTSHRIVIDGGGKVTLSGANKRQILYLNTCDQKQTWTTDHCQDQQWPQLTVQNITLEDGHSFVRQTATSNYGGGAIFDLGGLLKVVNTKFVGNRCYKVGPDLGGAAIRALEQWQNKPVYITGDTFQGGRCSNGGALSSIGVDWIVTNSLMFNNRAIGFGANPASPRTAGGGSGGAIYMDGDPITLTVKGTIIRGNDAREGGGAIFFVSDNNTGTVTIENSTLHHNPSAGFETAGFPGIFYQSAGHQITVINSTIN